MARTRRLSLLVLCCALAGCTSGEGGGEGATTAPSARVGFGGPASAAPVVSEVDEVIFRTPSKNIFCALHPSGVRCDILRKTWKPPAKPADCELDWGNGLYLSSGRTGITCTGDSLVGAATETLEYGRGYRSGDVRCDSESSGLTCKDEKSGRGFTLASARYSLF
jgi:hypothetical protein